MCFGGVFIMSEYQKKGSFPVPSRTRALSRAESEQEKPYLLTALKGTLIGSGVTLVAGILLTLCGAAVAYFNSDPSAFIPPFAIAALLLSMLAGGFAATKSTGASPVLCGILTGGATTLVTMLAAIILRTLPYSNYQLWQSLSLHFSAIAFSILGAILGNIKLTPKRPKRRFGR